MLFLKTSLFIKEFVNALVLYVRICETCQDQLNQNIDIYKDTISFRLYLSVKLIFAGAIFISYGLQFYVPVDIMWPKIRSWLSPGFLRRYGEYGLRVLFALFTCKLKIVILLCHTYSFHQTFCYIVC